MLAAQTLHGLAHAIAARDALDAEQSGHIDTATDLQSLAATAAERAGDLGRLDAALYLDGAEPLSDHERML